MEKYIYINPDTGKPIKENGTIYNNLLVSGIAPIRINETEFINNKKKFSNSNYKNKIEKLFDLSGFKIVKSGKNGDCLFRSISNAFKNPDINISFLRKLVADNITIQQFHFWKEIWESTLNEEFAFMDNINSFSELKDIIMTNEFWGEEVSINILQKELKIGIILIDSIINKIFKKFDFHDTLNYIILYYNGNHYDLVKYNNIVLFNKLNIPENVLKIITDNIIT